MFIFDMYFVLWCAQRFYSVQDPTSWAPSLAAYQACAIYQDGCDRGTILNQSFVTMVNIQKTLLGPALIVFFGSNKELWVDWHLRQWPWSAAGAGGTSSTAGSSSSSSSASSGGGSTFMSDLQ